MATQVVKDERAGAEIVHGSEMCRQKSMEVLEEMGLPKGLLPLRDVEECGYNRETGFVWLKQKHKCEHRFKAIGRLVSYATEITAYAEKYKLKKLTGVKSKEIFFWVSISEMSIDDPSSGNIYFKTSTGIGKTFPVSAFQPEEDSD